MNLLALMTHVSVHLGCASTSVARMAQSAVKITHKSSVSQKRTAVGASETICMPAGPHSLDDSSDHEFSYSQKQFNIERSRYIIRNILLTALSAAWCKQHLEVMFAVLSTFEFVENAVLEHSEALSTSGN